MTLGALGQAGTLENPTSYRDCNVVPLKHALVKQLNERYSACFNRLAKTPTSSSGWRNEPTSCQGSWPRACVEHRHKSCAVQAKFDRKQQLCRLKMNRAVMEQRRKEAAQKEFQRQQREQQRRRVEAERQRVAAARAQMAQIHKYKDSAIVSSHLAARMSGLRQPPIGGSYYLSQSISAVGTRFVTNTMADSMLQLERAVYGQPRGNGVRFVHGGYSANNPRTSMSTQMQTTALYNDLRQQANRTAVTQYELPLENMSVQSALVSGILSLIVQSQLDGESPDLQAALTNVIAYGVSAIIDGDSTSGPSTNDRRRNMFGLLEAEKKQKEVERERNKSYNYCFTHNYLARGAKRQKVRTRVGNKCSFSISCTMHHPNGSTETFRMSAKSRLIKYIVPTYGRYSCKR